MRVLFILNQPSFGASTHFRLLPYLKYFRDNVIDYDIRPIMENTSYQTIHQPNHYRSKLKTLTQGFVRRLEDVLHCSNYDVIYIQREAFSFGPPVFEYLFHKYNGRLMLDIDDAIFEPFSHSKNMIDRIAYQIKYGPRTFQIIPWCKKIHAGNKYLVSRVAERNPNVELFPTVMDTDYYKVKPETKENESVTIGWIGSPSTTIYLKQKEYVFQALAMKYGDHISFRFVGTQGYKLEAGVRTILEDWRPETEISNLHSFDIGIMPLDRTVWSRGRCGTKMLQYMVTGVPCVCSPEGSVKDIIQNGINGAIVDTDDEWIESLSELIEDKQRRIKLGRAGRTTIENEYSVQKWAPRFLKDLQEVAA